MSTDRTIPLDQATENELRQFACVNLGLEVPSNAKRATILAKIKGTYTRDEITLTDIGGPADALKPLAGSEKTEGQLAGEALLDRKVVRNKKEIAKLQALRDSEIITVFIDIQDSADGTQPVWVSVNERGQFIERGKDSEIRLPYLHALHNAIRRLYDQDEDNNMIPRDVLSYPVRVVSRRMPEKEAA